MKPRLILVSLGLAMLAIWSLGLQAQDAPKSAQPDKDEIITSEQQLLRQFAEFQDALLKLKQRMARGTPEERKRAELLGEVLDECKNLAVNQEFLKMIELMRGARFNNLGDLKIIQEQSDTVAAKLRKILDRLQDSKTNLSDETKTLKRILEDLGKVIDKEKTNETLNRLGRTDKNELKDNELANKKDVDAIKKKIDDFLNKDKKPGGPGGEAKNEKGENKDGGKSEGAKGEAKNDGKSPSEGAKGEAKNDGAKEGSKGAKGDKGETKPGQKGGEPKGGEAGEPKGGAKPGEPGKEGGAPPASSKKDKGGDKGDQGAAKKNDGDDKGDKKPGGAKDAGNKNPDPKKDGPQGSAKGDDKKSGGEASKPSSSPDSQAKPGGGEGKPGGGPEPKMIASKESKGDDKGGEGKPGDARGGSGKQGETKPGNSKAGQGQAKDGGASPDGSGGGSPPPSSAKGDAGDPPPPSAGGPPKKGNDDVQQSAKKIVEAGYDQKDAADAIPKDQKEIALKKQADAIQKMEEAKKKLEKLLQQMREEEIERVLAALQARCEKMLIMQQQVLLGTRDTESAVNKNADKKPTRDNKLDSLKLSDKEKEIVQEVNKCIDILEAEGSAVAFPEVFQQVRQDMIHVQKRLEVTDVHDVTQAIEQDIVDTLKEMIAALKKARDDNQPDPGKPGEPGKSGKPADPKLLELVQELKMVRSLQKRVNDRTNVYGKRYEGQEQTSDPQIVRELRNLADRQTRIQEIVRRIANGDNK